MGRASAVAALGPRLGVVVLGIGRPPMPRVPRLSTIASGEVDSVTGAEVQHLAGARLFTLTAGEASDCLHVIAMSRDGAGATTPTGGGDFGRPDDAAAVEVLPDPVPDNEQVVMVRALGVPRIEASGRPIPSGFRTKARELLVYLTLHHNGVTADAASTCCGRGPIPSAASSTSVLLSATRARCSAARLGATRRCSSSGEMIGTCSTTPS